MYDSRIFLYKAKRTDNKDLIEEYHRWRRYLRKFTRVCINY